MTPRGSRERLHRAVTSGVTACLAVVATAVSGVLPDGHARVAVALALVGAGLRPAQGITQALARRLLPLPSQTAADLTAAVVGLPADESGLDEFTRLLSELPGAVAARVSLDGADELRLDRTHPHGGWDTSGGERVVHLELPGVGRVDVVAERRRRAHQRLTEILHLAAGQASAYLRTIVLTAVLRREVGALEQQAGALEEMRRRLVAVSDAERSRLERNLHDGAQQQLTALVMQLGAAGEVAARSPARLPFVLAEVAVWAEDALNAVRDLGEGSDPRLLRREGLSRALLVHVSRVPLAVDIDIVDVGRHLPEVEATVYFSCLEAIHNALRHAAATRISVQLRLADDELVFVVGDDGRGFDTSLLGAGAGVTNLRDRIVSAGGSLDIVSIPGMGTTISGRVPTSPPVRELV